MLRGTVLLLSLLPALAGAQIAVPNAAPSAAVTGAPDWATALRHAVAACWNTGALSPEARATVVTLRVGFDAEARPLPDGITLRAGAPVSPAARETYASARRALIRCGAAGYPLPPADRALWQVMDLTFDPAAMVLR